MCPCNNTQLRDQWRKEAKERIAKKKVEEGICLTQHDLDNLSKKERIRLAKYMCRTEFK